MAQSGLSPIIRDKHDGGMHTMATENNLSQNYALDLQNAHLEQDGAVSKRLGRVKLTTNQFTGGGRVLNLTEFAKPDGTTEYLGYANTRLCRLENKLSGSGTWTTIKSGLGDDTPLSITEFNSFLINHCIVFVVIVLQCFVIRI